VINDVYICVVVGKTAFQGIYLGSINHVCES